MDLQLDLDTDSVFSPNEFEGVAALPEWSCTSTGYPRQKCIHWLFEEQAELSPESVAIVHGDNRISYRQLNSEANRLAHYLKRLGLNRESPVAICMDRSPEMVMGLLAILKAGGFYVPIDADLPTQRSMRILSDLESPLVLTTVQCTPAFAGYPGQVVFVDEAGLTESLPDSNPQRFNTASDLAYLMYTSGSTGQPKGVSIVHRGVVRLVKGTTYAKFGPDEIFFQLAPLSFDASTFEIWGPLLNGGRLAIPSAGLLSLAEIGTQVRSYGVTTLWLTAGLFHQMVEYQLDDLQGVKQLLAGGDVLAPQSVRKVIERLPHCRMINGYGPTENTTFTCCHAVERSTANEARIPIGRPIDQTEIYVFDPDGQLSPIGVPGELHIGGDGLARGYWRQPELTNEKFVMRDLGSRGLRRLYRTGDCVRWHSNGYLEFLGRLDHQVKIRGHRVEPGEIEHALLNHPQVEQAVVQPHDELSTAKQLVAFVDLQSKSSTTVADLRSYLVERLPSYMIPSAFDLLTKLPLTRNGKVDRQALPGLEVSGMSEEVRSLPATALEAELSRMWRDLLDIDRLDIHHTFLESGGDSLRALQLGARIRANFGVELPVEHLLARSTITSQAAQIEQTQRGVSHLDPSGPQIMPRDGELSLSLGQQRLWFMHQLEHGSQAYRIALGYRLVGPLDVELFERCLQEIVNRHESLRFTVINVNGAPQLNIRSNDSFALQRLDLRSRSEADASDRLDEQFTAIARQPFDIEGGPLLRATLAELNEADHAFLLTVHHLVFDGWSEGILFRELAELYAAGIANRPVSLPPLRYQYTDYAAWQCRRSEPERLTTARDFWKRQLAGAPTVLNLPTDSPRANQQSFAGRTLFRLLPSSIQAALNQLSRRQETTLFVTLMAAFQLLLHRLTGQDDFVVGTAVAGRERAELEALIGFFANPVALRTDLSGDLTFSELLKRVAHLMHETLDHAHLPFEEVVQVSQIDHRPGYPPLLQVLFVLHDMSLELPGIKVRRLPVDAGAANFDVTITAVPQAEGLGLWLEYNRQLFRPETVEHWFEQYCQILRRVVDDPHQPIRDVAPGTFSSTGNTRGSAPTESSESSPPTEVADVEIEEGLKRIWQRLLAVESIRSDDDFFLAGGHSLLLLELAAQLEREFKVRIPVNQLLQHRTIAAQSRVLREAEFHPSMICLRPGEGLPLVLLPKIGGEAFHCHDLIRHLPQDLPLQALDLCRQMETNSPNTLEALASICVEELQNSSIPAPYQLLGYSFGGMLAYETARQLEESGMPVAFVGLIDSGPSARSNPSPMTKLKDVRHFMANLPYWLHHKIRERRLISAVRYYMFHFGQLLDWTSKVHLNRSDADRTFADDELADALDGSTVEDQCRKKAHFRAYLNYVPKPYRGRVTLFRARVHPLLHHFTPDAGWSKSQIDELDIRSIPGSHSSILAGQQAQILAREIESALRRTNCRPFSE